MEKRTFDGELAVGALFGKGTDKALGEAMWLIGNDSNDYSGIIRLCGDRTKNAGTTARIITAAAIARPTGAHRLLKSLLSLSLQETYASEAQYFYLGMTLGLFEAALWFDIEWRTEEEFGKEFLFTVVKIILAPIKIEKEYIERKETRVTGQLSSAIRAWAKPSGDPKDFLLQELKGIRLAQVQRIIEDVSECIEKRKAANKDFKLSPLGDFILDQLTYAVFGQMAPTARAKALQLFFKNMYAELGLT